MNKDKYVFASLASFLDRNHFKYLVHKYLGDRYIKSFSCWNQLLSMMFGQLCNRDGLRDLVVALEAHQGKLYHLGMEKSVTRSNLSKAKEIDGYKQIGAGCGDARSFVDVQGNSLSNKKFHVECILEWDSTLSYQDSFKYYCMTDQKAFNNASPVYGYLLDTTCGSLEEDDRDDDRPYDSWHDRDADEVVTVFYHGGEETCDVEDVEEDFGYFIDEYYHREDDLDYCPHCGKRMLSPEYYDHHLYYSDITKAYYCCETCREEAERKHKQEQERETSQTQGFTT